MAKPLRRGICWLIVMRISGADNLASQIWLQNQRRAWVIVTLSHWKQRGVWEWFANRRECRIMPQTS